MASDGVSSSTSTPMISVDETAAAASAPNSSVSVPLQASSPASSSPLEPVISQVQTVAPIVSGFDPSLHGRLSNEQMRRAQEESIRKGFEDARRARMASASTSLVPSPYPVITSNPFETGYAYGQPSNASIGYQSHTLGTSSEPSSQRIFPVQQGINPSAHDSNLRPDQSTIEGAQVVPFSLGNRAPRTALANSGGMRRRLDSSGLKSIQYEPQAGVVASDAKIRAIGVALIEMGIREDQLTEVGVYLARHCADVGASDKSTLLGNFPGSNITLEEVGTKIKQTEGCTLRQYCAFYAKHVWNLMLQTQSPPANWVGKEFKFETRYAAFDFFFGVESSASLDPADGLIRLPTQAERVANATSKEIQMYRIRSMEGTQAVNFGEVTGGKVGPKPVLSIRK
uniref:Capsid protein n=7 Tax=Foveavirus mali TaxID=35350 RepID=G3GK43_9VIRU|nr:coat protein [Apple stem pitting virus]AEP02965.1 coat protein [Apple stem pitting virus]